MTSHPMDPVRSEQGVALIIVLLLLAVMAGLTTGLTLNGQTEIAMATNEAYYAGARGAADAAQAHSFFSHLDTNIQRILAGFKKAHPDIAIDYVRLSSAEMLSRVEQERASGVDGAAVWLSAEASGKT